MDTVERSVVVDVPVRTAYDQWTQFEEFPRFMEGIEEVRQLDDRRLYWRASIAGKTVAWDAEIVEQTPDRVIAWRSTTGAANAGTVSFEPVDGGRRTRITLRMTYQPSGMRERAAEALGFVDARVRGDLARFKEFIEGRGRETGAWRGEIHGGEVRPRGSDATWRYGDTEWATGHAHSSAAGMIDRDMPRDRSWDDGSYRERGVSRGAATREDTGSWGPMWSAVREPRYDEPVSHAGRGPRGYRRSDERVQDDVCRVLTEHPGIDATDIEVHVQDGAVTLAGMVRDRRQKWLAEDALERLPGVRDVENRIRVSRSDIVANMERDRTTSR